jgi:hypothetical protein
MTEELGALLIAKGFAPNEFILSNDGTLRATLHAWAPPWNLPSRMFQFPLEVQRSRPDQKWRVGLMHPLLRDHPFVKQVARAIRPFKIARDGAPNDCGYSKTKTALWWHAVDLIGQWRDLMETRRFTTDEALVRAVVFGLDYSKLRTGDARRMLAMLDVKEPAGKPVDTLQLLVQPHLVKPDDSAAYWPLNPKVHRENEGALAWGRIYGIEAGWFSADRKGCLHWSEAGRARYSGGPGQLTLPL